VNAAHREGMGSYWDTSVSIASLLLLGRENKVKTEGFHGDGSEGKLDFSFLSGQFRRATNK
jgi:hypothetical protein